MIDYKLRDRIRNECIHKKLELCSNWGENDREPIKILCNGDLYSQQLGKMISL